jgi:hypothetical protein
MARGVQERQDAAVAVAEEVHRVRVRGEQRLLDGVGQVAVGVVLQRLAAWRSSAGSQSTRKTSKPADSRCSMNELPGCRSST